jgi:signal transduction histidine kinase
MQDASLDIIRKDEYIPPYGDVTKLNHCRLIMDSVGSETLKVIGKNAVKLLDTSVAIYEANGDYAFGMFSSQWCRLMDLASRQLCKTNDNRKALSCGKWLCHENCWNDSAKRAIETGKSTDIECVGGIHIYAEPIYAGKNVIGSINIGYGDPPKDPAKLKKLAAKFGVDPEKLKEVSENYKLRPQFIVDGTKNLLGTFAKLIGNIVEKTETEKKLAENEKWLIQAQKISHTGSWKLDLTSYCLTWSDETYRIFGCRPKDFSPNYKSFLELPSDQDPRLHPRNNCIHQGYASVALIPIRTSDRIVGLIQLNDKRKDRFTLETIEILKGIAAHIGSALMRKRAEEEKKKADQEAKDQQFKKFESLSRMAAAIAHHFNNQLAVVLGNLEMVLYDLPEDAKNHKKIFRAFKAGKKAAEKSAQMLRYLGDISGSQSKINLSEVCRKHLAILGSSLNNGVTVNVDFPDYKPFVYADAGQVQQILNNLFTNSLEALQDNQGTIALAVQTVSHEDISTSNRFPLDWQPENIPYACLKISDTGLGIARGDIEKIFDPFYTTKFIGRGMGFPETMGILKNLGGCIKVDSELNSGSVFEVYLPVISEEKTVKNETISAKKEIENGGTILLIDDEKWVRNITKEMLTELGCNVIEAQDGIEGVRLFQKHHRLFYTNHFQWPR